MESEIQMVVWVQNGSKYWSFTLLICVAHWELLPNINREDHNKHC